MSNCEFPPTDGRKVSRIGDLGLQYFWKKKKWQWFSQDLPCLIRYYYYIWWCGWMERFNPSPLMSYFINTAVWRSAFTFCQQSFLSRRRRVATAWLQDFSKAPARVQLAC